MPKFNTTLFETQYTILVSDTNTAAALYNTTDMIKRQGRHDDGVPVVVVFLTDGKSNVNKYLTVPAAEYLHAELPKVGISLYAKPYSKSLYVTYRENNGYCVWKNYLNCINPLF